MFGDANERGCFQGALGRLSGAGRRWAPQPGKLSCWEFSTCVEEDQSFLTAGGSHIPAEILPGIWAGSAAPRFPSAPLGSCSWGIKSTCLCCRCLSEVLSGFILPPVSLFHTCVSQKTSPIITCPAKLSRSVYLFESKSGGCDFRGWRPPSAFHPFSLT